MKILYAASRRSGATSQLNRILAALGDAHTIKIAAYASNGCSQPIDWTLDALLHVLTPNLLHFDGENLSVYCQQVEAFAPDLIISDLEPFTSYIATELGIEIWQLSSSLARRGTREGAHLGIRQCYLTVLDDSQDAVAPGWFPNALHNADRKLIYSHFGDLAKPLTLEEGFEWVRPYHLIGKPSVPCQHNIVAISPDNNKQLLNALKGYDDTVVFSNFPEERYVGLTLKNAANLSEYACNLRNCQVFISDGHTNHLADAFYNGIHPYIFPNFFDRENIINFALSEELNTASTIYDLTKQLLPIPLLATSVSRPEIQFLDELI